MVKERLKSPRLRAFVALELPGPVLDGIVDWQGSELRDPALRALSREQLHITLAFLGWQAEKDVAAIAAIVNSTEAEAPPIELQPEAAARPPKRRPRIFALEARSEATVRIQADVERRLLEAGFYEPEKRRYWPHVTVARVRKESGTGREMRVERPPGRLPRALLEPFRAVRLTLYRSILRRAGAEYVPLAQVELPEERATVR